MPDELSLATAMGDAQPPGDWREATLSSVAEVRFSSVDKVTRPSEDPVRLCNYIDIYDNDYITGDLGFMQASATQPEILRFGLQLGDVIITKDSETPDDIGIPAVVDYAAPDLVCGYHLGLIRPNHDAVDPTFLAKQLGHHRVARYFGRQANGLTRYGLPLRAVNNTRLWLPGANEQRAIGIVLRLVDEAIAKATAVIMKLKQIGYGLLHDLLTRGLDEHGQLRDPLAHPEQFEDSSLGRIPKKWRIVQLRDIAIGEGVYGSGAAAKSYDPHLPRYVRITDITDDGTLDNNSLASVDESDAGPYLLREGDLVFARSGATVGKTYLYRAHDGRCAHAGYVIKFAIDPTKASPHFVFFWTKSSMYWRWVNRMLRQGAQPNINAAEYATHLLTVPPIEERGQITKILEEFAVARAKETAVLEKLVSLKSGLANDLLTGRIRVPESLFPREASP